MPKVIAYARVSTEQPSDDCILKFLSNHYLESDRTIIIVGSVDDAFAVAEPGDMLFIKNLAVLSDDIAKGIPIVGKFTERGIVILSHKEDAVLKDGTNSLIVAGLHFLSIMVNDPKWKK